MRAYIHAYVHPIHDISDLGLKARTRFGVLCFTSHGRSQHL